MKDLKLKINLAAFDKVSKPFKEIAKNSAKLQSSFTQTIDEMKSLKAATQDLASFEKLQSNLGKDAQALKDAQLKAQTLGQQLKATGNHSIQMAQAFEKARANVVKLKAAQNEHMAKLQAVSSRLQQANLSTTNLSQSHRMLEMRIKKTNAILTEHAKKLNHAKAQALKLKDATVAYQKCMASKANLSVAGFAGVQTGQSMARMAGSLINPGISFEESMSKVGALARIDKTSESFAKLQAQAEQLGATTSFSATEAADGMSFLAMAGFKTNEILAAMPATLALAKAGGTDLAVTADIASNILSGFSLEATEMSRVSDVLAATFTRSNVDLTMLGDSMKYVAPIVKELGGSIEDAAAMSGLLGNVGIQGSQAGTAMRAMYNRMAAPPKMAADAIAKLSLKVSDAQGNMRPMVDLMGEIAQKTKDMGNTERMGIFKAIAGEEAGTAFAQLINQGGAGEITKFIEILKTSNGEVTKIAKQMGDNTAGDIKAFSSAYEGMGIALTQTNNAPMRELIQMGTEMVRSTTDWIKANPELAATLLKIMAVGVGLVTVLGGLALGVAGILGPLAMAKWSLMSLGIKVIPLVTGAFRMMGIAMAANPIGIVVVAIAAAAAGAYMLYEAWGPITEWFSEFWDSLPDKISAAIKWLSSIMSPLGWIADKVGGLFADSEPIKKIATATVATAMVATPTLATKPVERTPQAVVTEQNTQHISIKITASPGMDADAIARAVRDEIQKIERERASRNSSRFWD